ncbi:MAG: ABC-2 family transporter protein [Chloroflexi bacterium]|nr:ABC-2 family transporter protein [Chloroflexota bacterium]
MRLYLVLARMAVADAIQYRVESSIYFLYEILPPVMMAFMWLAAYESQSTVAGFTLGEMLAYTLGVMALRGTVSVHVEWALDHEIRQGLLSTHLMRPMNYWAYLLVDALAWRSIRMALSIPLLLGSVVLLGPWLGEVAIAWDRLPALLVSVVLAFVVCFFLKLCVGFIGFWTNDIVGITTLYEVVASVLGGILIPIALLPEWAQTVARLLPIQAIYATPLAIMLGKSEGADPLTGILLQLGWIVVLWGLATVLWRAGLRQYESVGG